MRASRAVAAGAAAGCAPAAQQAPAARQKMRMHIGVVLTRVFLSPGWPASPYDVECDWPSPAFVDTPTGASMRLERPMARRKRRKFTDEFKADAVKLCAAGGRSVTQVASDLDLTETALREWVKRAAVDAGKNPPNVLTTAERDELSELRKRVKRLEMEREILKKAAAFFAKENAGSSGS